MIKKLGLQKKFAVLQMIILFFLKISTCHLRSFSTNPQSYPQLLLIFPRIYPQSLQKCG